MRKAALLLTVGAALAVSACQGEVAEAHADIAESATAVIDLSVEELIAAQAAGTIRLIDVRSNEEVAGGMIPGAEHIVLDDLAPASLDPSDGREVVFHCRSGRRSANAAMRLSTHLGEPVRHLEGGILAWEEAGQPISALTASQ